ncbi:hypothetical protein J5N97_006044 [Dioscorea zingiberensis]|uniref:Uncharacterized protein n=1 Tax=Dioscorea zingiberensis TaxID=325984 RepID=A0A9D5D9H9_9LILI|nr:hypothetical protein J5N97_006044 [Dioscorea zingiberensis]
MVAGDPFGMEEDDLGKKQICPSPDGYMDDKENICAGNDLVVPKETPMLRPRSSRKAKGFNLRKSLAWNNAFFTEEGVLDPMELSTLTTGSVSKMNGTSLSVNKGAMSPLMRFNHSGERSKPAFHDLEEKMCSKGSAKSRVKDAKGSKTISKLEVSIHGEPDMDVVSERISSGKEGGKYKQDESSI